MEPEPGEGFQWRAGCLLSALDRPPAGGGIRRAAFPGMPLLLPFDTTFKLCIGYLSAHDG
jgi:hypothetical protein